MQSKILSACITLLLVAYCSMAQDYDVDGQTYYVAGPGRDTVSWDMVRSMLPAGGMLLDMLPMDGFLRSMDQDDIQAVMREEIEWATNVAWPNNDSVTFENWAQTEQFSPAKAYSPRCVEDIQAAVLEAKRDGKRIRAVGRTHSESPIYGTEGEYLIYTNYLNKITPCLDGPQDTWTVRLETGVTTGDFKKWLLEHDLAIPSNVVLDVVKMGGVITTGCHGTGTHETIVSDRVTELRIVDSEGVLRTFREGDTPEHIMRAARVNLGLFGILYDFKIKVDPTKHIKVRDFKPRMDEVFLENNGAMLRDLAMNHYAVEFFWYPFNERFWVKQFDVTDEEVTGNSRTAIMQTFQHWIEMNFAIFEQHLIQHIPRLTPIFTRLAFAALRESTYVVKLPEAVHFRKFIDAARISMYEVAININTDEDFNKFIECWYWVVNRVNELAEEQKYPFNLAMEARFIKQGTSLLSPPHDYNFTAYIELITGAEIAGGRDFYNEAADAWEQIDPHSRIHWSKFSHFIPDVANRFKRQYGDDLIEFERIRSELNVDPDRMFFNNFFDDVFSH